MADYTPTRGRAKHATLGASTEDKVILTGNAPWIEVQNQGVTGVIYVTCGPNVASTDAGYPPAATVAGDDTIAVPPGQSRFLRWPSVAQMNGCVVRLIAGSAIPYAVQGIQG